MESHTCPARRRRITAVHAASRGAYGARRVHAELVLGHGLVVGHGTTELLMRRAQLKGLPGSRRPPAEAPAPTAADLVDRAFTRTGRDQLWVTDITEHPTREGKVYCAVAWTSTPAGSSGVCFVRRARDGESRAG